MNIKPYKIILIPPSINTPALTIIIRIFPLHKTRRLMIRRPLIAEIPCFPILLSIQLLLLLMMMVIRSAVHQSRIIVQALIVGSAMRWSRIVLVTADWLGDDVAGLVRGMAAGVAAAAGRAQRAVLLHLGGALAAPAAGRARAAAAASAAPAPTCRLALVAASCERERGCVEWAAFH